MVRTRRGGRLGGAKVRAAAKAVVVEGLEGRRLLDGSMFSGSTVPLQQVSDFVLTGDVDGDGHVDVLAGDEQGGNVQVALGKGDGTFSVLPKWQAAFRLRGATLADFDGDGKLDLAAVVGNDCYLWIGQGDGTFGLGSDLAVAPGGYGDGVVAADFDHDGRMDLAVGNWANGISVRLGRATGYESAEYALPSLGSLLAAGDVNGDGFADLFAANYTDNTFSVLLNSGDGAFTVGGRYATGGVPRSIQLIDFTGDGKVDAVVASDGLSLLRGNGDGTFSASSVLAPGWTLGAAVADFNGDGRLDLAYAYSSGLTVMWGGGGGSFASTSEYTIPADGLSVADVNEDGKPDIVTNDVWSGDSVFGLLINTSTTDVPPAISDIRVQTMQGNGHLFSTGEFEAGFSDMNSGDTLQGIRIEWLPSHGTLMLGDTPVSVGQAIGAEDMQSLRYTPAADYLGLDRFGWSASDGQFYSTKASAEIEVRLFAPEIDSPIGTAADELASGDFNKDGKLDLVVANAGYDSLTVLQGNGDGTFVVSAVYAVGHVPLAVQVGDIDGDGSLDVVAAGAGTNAVSILLGKGDGTFEAARDFSTNATQATDGPKCLQLADFDADGRVDVLVSEGGCAYLMLNQSSGGFSVSSLWLNRANATGLAIGDANLDGKLDLVASFESGGNVTVLLADGRGSFSGSTVNFWTSNLSVRLADVNEDGKLDVVTSAGVALGNGDGSFATATMLPSAWLPADVAIADFDGDGHQDVATSAYDCQQRFVRLWRGDGDGGFRSAVPHSAGTEWGKLLVADFNGDGRPDVVTGDGPENRIVTLLDGAPADFRPRAEISSVQVSSSRQVTLEYRLADAEEENCDVVVEYSVDAAWTWHAATPGIGGEGTSGLSASKAGVAHTFAWDAGADLGMTGSRKIAVRVRPRDSAEGLAGTTTFSINQSPMVDVELNTTTPTRLSMLTATADAADADGDALTFTFVWKVDGIERRRITTDRVSDTVDLSPPSWLGFATNVSVEVIASDSLAWASASAVATIQNQAPVAMPFALTFVPTGQPQAIAFNNSYTDADAGDYLVGIRITRLPSTGTLFVGSATSTPVVLGTLYSSVTYVSNVAQQDSFEWCPFDGRAYGAPVTVTLMKPLFDARQNVPARQDGGIIAADFDNDGIQDLLCYGGAETCILWGNGDRAFGLTIPMGFSRIAAVGDFNSDGKTDIAVMGNTVYGFSSLTVLLNQGNRSFAVAADSPCSISPLNMVAADINGDGVLDLMGGDGTSGYVHTLTGCGDGNFRAGMSSGWSGLLVAGDFDRDGIMDVAVSAYSSFLQASCVRMMHGYGNGAFTRVSETAISTIGGGIVAADLNGDGWLDVAVSGGQGFAALINDHNGSFTVSQQMAVGANTFGICAADINGDGIADLAVVDQLKRVSYVIGMGDGAFGPITHQDSASGNSLASGDFNGDGRTDLAISASDGYVKILYNNSSIPTAPTIQLATPRGPQHGMITLPYRLFDPASQTQSVQVEYSIDAGQTWVAATQGGGDALTSAAAAVTGSAHTFVWDSAHDLPTALSAMIRLTTSNGSHSVAVATDAIALRNVNHVPSATMSLDSHTPATNTLLKAMATRQDPDGDQVRLTWVWKVNGVVKRTFSSGLATSDSFDLALDGNGEVGDVITVKVKCNDGTADGATVSEAFTVQPNYAPVATVALSPRSPLTRDTLVATATKSDWNGDRVSLTWVWKVNGVIMRTFTSSTDLTDSFDLSQAGNGDRGDTVTVKVTANDGSVDSAAARDAVAIGNTLPIVGWAIRTDLMQRQSRPFAAYDFTRFFNDYDGDAMAAVKVLTLPQHGSLTLDGIRVEAGQEIPAAQLTGLMYTATPGYIGSDGFSWTARDGFGYSAGSALATFNISAQSYGSTLTLAGDSWGGGITLGMGGGIVIVSINGKLAGYDLAGVGSIMLDCGSWDDLVIVSGNVPGLVINGGEGNDTLIGGDGDDTLFGGAGNDAISGGAGHDALRGEDGNDTLYGDAGDDRLYGDKGYDVLSGGDGNDRMDGGTGNDAMWGGRNADLMAGAAGNDLLYGEDGKDTLLGGEQNDTLDGGAGWDSLDGGTGDDVIFAIDAVTYTDTVVGGGGNDVGHVNELLDVVSGVGEVVYA